MNMVTAIARQLIERGVVQRAYLGVRMDDSFGPATAARLGLPRPQGALIDDVTPDTPADNAGMRVGDVVLRFANVSVDDYAHLKNLVGLTEVDTEVPVIVFRDRQEITLMVQVGNAKDRP
jgi:S1-C subfamily serine protease